MNMTDKVKKMTRDTEHFSGVPRTVFITGAGRGIGRATAERFLTRGWTVGVFDITDDVSWADDLPGAMTGRIDVRKTDSWAHALEHFQAQLQPNQNIDVVINNAGLLYAGPFIEGSAEEDSRLVDVNVKGVLFGARAAYPHLKRSRGMLVNLASASAIYGTPDMATYSATKFAVRGLTEALDVEWDPDGIAVVAAWPLYVSSPMLDEVSTAGTRKMGVKLTPDSAAKKIVALVLDRYEPSQNAVASVIRRVMPRSVHHPLDPRTALLAAGSRMSPSGVTRYVNGLLTTDRRLRWSRDS